MAVWGFGAEGMEAAGLAGTALDRAGRTGMASSGMSKTRSPGSYRMGGSSGSGGSSQGGGASAGGGSTDLDAGFAEA